MTDVGSPPDRAVQIGVLDIIRFLIELFAFASLAIWGAVSWPLPWNIVIGVAAPAAAILLWALFVSPKAVVRLDVFGKAIVEIVVIMAAALAWWQLGHLVVAIVFTTIATATGVLRGRRELTATATTD